jgi:hypothetical protein
MFICRDNNVVQCLPCPNNGGQFWSIADNCSSQGGFCSPDGEPHCEFGGGDISVTVNVDLSEGIPSLSFSRNHNGSVYLAHGSMMAGAGIWNVNELLENVPTSPMMIPNTENGLLSVAFNQSSSQPSMLATAGTPIDQQELTMYYLYDLTSPFYPASNPEARGVIYSADGSIMLTYYQDGPTAYLALREPATGNPVGGSPFAVSTNDGWDITTGAVSPDGSRIAVGLMLDGDPPLGICKIYSGFNLVAEIEDSSIIHSAAFSPDGLFLALSVGYTDGANAEIKIYETTNWSMLHGQPDAESPSGSVLQFTKDSRLLIAGERGTGNLSFYRVFNNGFLEFLAWFEAHTEVGAPVDKKINSIALAQDLPALATGGHNEIKIWDLPRLLFEKVGFGIPCSFDADCLNTGEFTKCFDLGVNGDHACSKPCTEGGNECDEFGLVCCQDNQGNNFCGPDWCWECALGNCGIEPFRIVSTGQNITSLDFKESTPGDHWLVAGSSSGDVSIFFVPPQDVPMNEIYLVRKLENLHSGQEVLSAAFQQEIDYLWTSSSNNLAGSTLYQINTSDSDPAGWNYEKWNSPTNNTAGALVATTSKNSSFNLIASAKLAIDQSSRFFLRNQDGSIKSTTLDHGSTISKMKFTPAGDKIAVLSDETIPGGSGISIWDTQTEEVHSYLEQDRNVYDLCFSQDNRWRAIVSKGVSDTYYQIKITDYWNGNFSFDFPDLPIGFIENTSIHGQNVFIYGENSGFLSGLVYDSGMEEWQMCNSVVEIPNGFSINSMAISQNENYLAIGSNGQIVVFFIPELIEVLGCQ